MRSKSEIIKFIVYNTLLIPIIIFILEITFFFINKSSSNLLMEQNMIP